ncbi:hypothetical protein ONS95_005447 [Cadophora gregata]|uniref:uncharacterized protein n=1 Tax=Cadophora gregata TaxID=51156 RepID=UPI0026DAFE8D|nr:uncharacterized protein ONS95_005447 [Cadophora gregata]KAK0103423.1 hypothetical protein ONS95_005447 [Cadophora gregata]KAK0107611.1 hypothetical protein ONS96_003417 [Cadophora gregata f. sp. sojae]
MTHLEEFSFFPLLSAELRLQVWQEALLIPRLVLIWKHRARDANIIHRSVVSPLLCVNHESRNEALKLYAPPPYYPTSPETPVYIGPGTDIVYIAGLDGERRAFKHVTWTCDFLAQDLDSQCPSFAPLRRLAIDEEFLQQTPCLQFSKMPYSVWKLIISDLPDLEELILIRRGSGCGWSVSEVEEKLMEAKEKFVGFWEVLCADEGEAETLVAWRVPSIRILKPEELVEICWV